MQVLLQYAWICKVIVLKYAKNAKLLSSSMHNMHFLMQYTRICKVIVLQYARICVFYCNMQEYTNFYCNIQTFAKLLSFNMQ